MPAAHGTLPEESDDQRFIQINRLQQTKFVRNKISTAKYNFATFVPRFLFEQFRRYANIFFLFIALMQQIPDVSPTGRYTTAFPLLCILLVSAAKEIVEDWKRHNADKRVNRSKTLVLQAGQWTETTWQDVQVGNCVKILNDQFFPADLVLLSSSEPQGMCYVQTSNLDGETNLKIRQGHKKTAHFLSHDDLYKFYGTIECEPPNRYLYEFTGIMKSGSFEEQFSDGIPLGPEQVLQRGAQLKNTNWVFGTVVYTGHETKLMMNSTSTPLKRSNVDRVTNNQILILFVVLLVMSLISAIAAQVWSNQNAMNAWYLSITGLKSAAFGYNFLTFIILYNNLIPISLQVTLEVVRFIQALFINWDSDMYYAPTDQPAMARTSNLNEELGQVKYIFTDKTGTLTRNVMQFRKCSVAGVVYGNDQDGQFNDSNLVTNLSSRHVTASVIREFLTLLSVCHTVVPEKDESGKIIYQASSPDEGSLVRGANEVGFVFHTRTPDSLTIDALGRQETYEVLNVLEFTSTRKRMGVIVRTPQGKLKLFVKGADNVIYERLSKDQLYAEITLKHLEEFATTGYRTLCIAKADLSEEFYEEWNAKFYQASISLQNREEKLAEVCELVETDLHLLGATAIEDKLQEGVPEAISSLLKADCKIWVLTGDKQETAINIGHSSKLISPGMPLLIINRESAEATREQIVQYVEDMGQHIGQENELALVINGRSLKYALAGDVRREFLDLAISCRVVVCCRVTPIQKAEVVELVKKSVGAITLAIGDGANDVAMIQAAHVGIGICGVEGLQAACASDYAIAQFRFLTKLLLVHGAWSYHRMIKLILYSFHKNICLYIIELWFAIYSAWSGQTLFDRWCIGLYNVIFTAAPPLAIGLFDRTASAETMMRFPSLYKLSQNRASFSVKVFWLWIITSIYHSIILFWLSKIAFAPDDEFSSGKQGGLFFWGTSCYTYVVVLVCLKAGLEIDAWTWLTHLAIWGSILSWLIFVLIYCNLWPVIPIASEMVGIDTMMYTSGVFWFCLILIPFTGLLVDFIYKIIRRTLFKTIADEVRELELSHIDPSQMLPILNRSRRTSSNAGASYEVWYRRNTLPKSNTTSGLVDNEHLPEPTPSPFTGQLTPSRSRNRFTETARLLRNIFKRSASAQNLADEARRGYAFSQEEDGVVRQSEVVRSYDSTKNKPEGN